MELTHTADDGLAGLGIGLDGEGRILFRELAEGNAELVQVALGLRLDCDADNRIGEFHSLESELVAFVADGISGVEILESDCCADVTGLHELDRVLVVGVHLVEPGDTLFLTGA